MALSTRPVSLLATMVFTAIACTGNSPGGSGGSGGDTIIIDDACEAHEALSVEGDCIPLPDDALIFRVDGSDVDWETEGGESPDSGSSSTTDDPLVAEACCIFAVDPYYYILVDAYGQPAIFTGACMLPVPWSPGAYGCGCIGNNLIIDPWTGAQAVSYGSWIGFTCIID